MTETSEINPFSIDHIVVNVDKKYQEDTEIIERINSAKLPYMPSKGKGNKGFKASNLWIGDEYFEFIQIKTNDGGGWIKEWVAKYNAGHRGVIGMFLKTDDIEQTSKSLADFNITKPERITFPLFFNLIHISAKWRNSYLPYFANVPMQIGFQQVDNQKIAQGMRKRMEPNSEKNGLTGIKKICFLGPFSEEDFKLLESLFYCKTISSNQIEILLRKNQSIEFYRSEKTETHIFIEANKKIDPPILIENLIISSNN